MDNSNEKRNFGLGSRDMQKAGTIALERALSSGQIGYETVARYANSFNKFADFAKQNGVKDLRFVDRELIKEYANSIKNENLSPSAQQNRITAVNSVMKHALAGVNKEWKSVGAVKDGGIEKRSNVRTERVGGMDRERLNNAMTGLNEREKSIVLLTREFGLRTREAALLNAKGALNDALKTDKINIVHAKNGRPRTIHLTNKTTQIAALRSAAQAQGDGRSLVPQEKTYIQFKNSNLRNVRNALKTVGVRRIHDLRAAYANERYQQITGVRAPAAGGPGADKATDKQARLIISKELGHNRLDVVNSYCGKRS